jgi:hypothetical protein
MSYSYILGPFLECRTAMVAAVEMRRGCQKDKTVLSDSGTKFCPICGSALVEYPVTIERPKVDRWELAEQIDETLHVAENENNPINPTRHTWVSNRSDIYKSIEVGTRTDVIYLDEADKSQNEMRQFADAFSKELVLFRAVYDSVWIRWGIVCWYA